MSGPQGEIQQNANGGIRLPPISFLSGVSNPQPSAQSAKRGQGPGTQDPQEAKNGTFFSHQNGNGIVQDKRKAPLPEPQPVNLYPTQNSSYSSNQQTISSVENSGHGAIPGMHHHHHHYNQPHHHHHHHHNHHNHHHNNHSHSHSHNQSQFQNHVIGLEDSANDGSMSLAQSRALSRATKLAEARSEFRNRQKKKAFSRVYEKLAQDFPVRRHLGSIVYNPTTTWATLQFEQLHGLLAHDKDRFCATRAEFMSRKAENWGEEEQQKYIPVIPPLSGFYINNLLDVKIPYKHIKSFLESRAQGQVERKRELWGGTAGIYTDDSNLLYVLCHLGLFDGNLDLSESNCNWTMADFTQPAFTQKDADGVELLDLSVTLLLLPGLNQYRGFYRNGVNSRSWTDKPAHNGLSIAVFNVKYETFLSSMGERTLSKKARSEYIEDKAACAEIAAQKNGWAFDSSVLNDFRQKSRDAS